MKCKLFYILVFYFFPTLVFAQTPKAQWARSVTSSSTQSEFNSVFSDGGKNVYTVGDLVGGTAAFGNGVRVTAPEPYPNILLVKYDSNGIAQWAKSLVSASNGTASSLAAVTGDSKNIYTAGTIQGTGIYDFGNNITLNSANKDDTSVLLLSYNDSGDANWAKTAIAKCHGLDSWFQSIANDNIGNIYAAGFLNPGIRKCKYDFGNGVMSNVTIGSVPVLVKYDNNGNPKWAQNAVCNDARCDSKFSSIAVDQNGNIYAAGDITFNLFADKQTYDFGNGIILSSDDFFGNNFLLAKYNSNGVIQWAKTISTKENSDFSSIALDSKGDMYAAGTINGNELYDFGDGVTVTGSGTNLSTDIVIVKYSNEGKAQWAKSVSKSPGDSSFTSIAIDSFDNVYAVGSITGEGIFDFGNGVTVNGVSSGYPGNIIIVKYDSNGNTLWGESLRKTADFSVFNSVTTNGSGQTYTAGTIVGTAPYDFGNGSIVNGAFSGGNVVLVQYSS